MTTIETIETIKAIELNKQQYYHAIDLMKIAPVYFKGMKSVRELIKKNKVTDGDFAYAKQDKNNWKLSDGKSMKLDKLFVTIDWTKKNIPEFADNKDEVKYEIEIAPNIITLEDTEKFKSDTGEILDIEVRGERHPKKCYFRVKDVMDRFKMEKLHSTLIHKESKYEHEKDYKYYTFQKSGKKIKKELFLTFSGFRKLIEISRTQIDYKMRCVMHKWLNQFDKSLAPKNYQISISHNKKNTIGYTYCATSKTLNAVKIGFWRGSIDGLRQRYITPYGKDLHIYCVKTKDARNLESNCHIYFSKMNITNELYDKNYWNEYVEYLENNKIDVTINDIIENTEIDTQDCDEFNMQHIANYEIVYIDDELFKNITIICDTTSNMIYFNLDNVKENADGSHYDIDDVSYIVNNHTNKKELYLTYRGMLKVLFSSRSGKANTFIDWATDTLFTHQMGTPEQKQKLVCKTLGITTDALKEVFNTTSTTIPCVYLFSLNTVKQLRKSMDIPIKYKDDDIVLKYGFTDNLKRRTSEHEKYCTTIKNTELKLKYWSYIDPQYISSAETDITDFFKLLNCHYEYNNKKELVIVSQKILPQIEKRYKQTGELYGGHIKELTNKINELNNKIKNMTLEHKNEILELKVEYNSKIQQMEIEKRDDKNKLLEEKNKLLEEKNKFLEEKNKVCANKKK